MKKQALKKGLSSKPFSGKPFPSEPFPTPNPLFTKVTKVRPHKRRKPNGKYKVVPVKDYERRK
jgi:hypothetical protein